MHFFSFINADTIASFLQIPRASMPGLPLTEDNAKDVAAYIMSLKDIAPDKSKK